MDRTEDRQSRESAVGRETREPGPAPTGLLAGALDEIMAVLPGALGLTLFDNRSRPVAHRGTTDVLVGDLGRLRLFAPARPPMAASSRTLRGRGVTRVLGTAHTPRSTRSVACYEAPLFGRRAGILLMVVALEDDHDGVLFRVREAARRVEKAYAHEVHVRTQAVPGREAIERALIDSGGNKRRAALALGISRTTLYRRIEELSIDVFGHAPVPGGHAIQVG
jgi:hypothetical protein